MSAIGTVSSADRASWGDNVSPCWRVWFNLDNPRALPDTGPERPDHSWAVDLPREPDPSPTVWAKPPCNAGDRIEVSTHGRLTVTIAGVEHKSLAGVYDPETRL